MSFVKLKSTLSLIFLIMTVFAFSAEAKFITDANMISEKFTCSTEARGGILTEYKIKTPGATTHEKSMVASAMQRIENVAGGKFSYFKNKIIAFREELSSGDRGCKGGLQTPEGMLIARKMCHAIAKYNKWKRKTNPHYQGARAGQPLMINETTLIHEIGHQVGNTDGHYQAYDEAVRPRCMVSHYSANASPQNARGEEFAEAFASYVVNPAFLAKACPKAYGFFKKKVFQTRRDPAACNQEYAKPGSKSESAGSSQMEKGSR